jgi:hypothetical protein
MLFRLSGSELFDTFTNIILFTIFPLQNIYAWKMLRKIKWQILAARYYWCQRPVPGRGPAVEKHWCRRCNDSLRAGRSGDGTAVGSRFSAPVQTSLEAYPAFYIMRTGSLSRGHSGRDVGLTTHVHLAPTIKKEYSYSSTLHLGLHGLF